MPGVKNDFLYSGRRSWLECSVFSLVLGLPHMLSFIVAIMCNSSYPGGETLEVYGLLGLPRKLRPALAEYLLRCLSQIKKIK